MNQPTCLNSRKISGCLRFAPWTPPSMLQEGIRSNLVNSESASDNRRTGTREFDEEYRFSPAQVEPASRAGFEAANGTWQVPSVLNHFHFFMNLRHYTTIIAGSGSHSTAHRALAQRCNNTWRRLSTTRGSSSSRTDTILGGISASAALYMYLDVKSTLKPQISESSTRSYSSAHPRRCHQNSDAVP